MLSIKVGDPHVKPSNIVESADLMNLVFIKASELKVSHVDILGDLFDTHLVIRMDVMDFWRKVALKADHLKIQLRALVGNHDMSGDRQREGQMSALDSLKGITPYFKVIDSAQITNNVAYIPYMSEEKAFTEIALDLLSKGATELICHQTFQGSKFENGMYAPHGFSVELLSGYKNITSGHIHSTQKFSNVFYPGTAKWESLSDANREKGIWLFETDQTPKIISTEGVCKPIKLIDIKEGQNEDVLILPNNKNYIVLHGTSSWISKKSKQLKGLGKITPRPNDVKIEIENRNEKIASIDAYADIFPFKQVSKEEVLAFLETL